MTYLFAKLARTITKRILSKTTLRPSLVNLMVLFSSLGLWVFGLMIAAIIAFPSLTPAKMLAGLGIGSVAIGFAFKDIFENFLAGIIILLRKEMRINDFISCQGYEGTVEAILVRETHIRETDGELVILPNSMLFKNPLTIRTDIDQRRTTIICGVGYGENVDDARAVINTAVANCKTVISDSRPVEVFANEFADSSINFEVSWWTGSKPIDIRKSRDEVVAAIKSALDEAEIEIPFPYRTLTFNQPIGIENV
jgi:small-conductance mechanosensitive channel